MSEKFVTIYRNVNLPPVDMVRTTLESEGILCNVKGYDATRPYLSFGIGIELQVPEDDKKRAEEIMKELNIDK